MRCRLEMGETYIARGNVEVIEPSINMMKYRGYYFHIIYVSTDMK